MSMIDRSIIVPVVFLLLSSGLVLIILMLVHPKTRPWAIALLMAGSFFLFLKIGGSFLLYRSSTRYNEPYSGTIDTMTIQQNPLVTVNTNGVKVAAGNNMVSVGPNGVQIATGNKLLTVNPNGTKEIITNVEKNIASRPQQSAVNFRFSPQFVQHVLLPIPQVTSVESLKKKIAALEAALKDIKQVLAKTLDEGAEENISKAPEAAAPVNIADAAVVTTIAAATEKPAQVQEAAANKSPANKSTADNALPITVNLTTQLIAKYRQILQNNPDSPDAYNLLGNALIEAGRSREAIEYLKRALVIQPVFHKAHNNLGKALLQTGRPREAVESLQEAIRLWPPYTEAHYNLGNALVELGRVNEAIVQYKQALRYSNDDYPQARNKQNALLNPAAVPKPEWIGKPPRRVGDSYEMSLATGPYTTRLECDAKIPEVLQSAMDQFVEAYLGRPAVGWVRLPSEQLRQLVAEEWEEHLQSSVGPMTQVHLLVNFDQKAKNFIDEAMSLSKFTERAVVAGVGLIGLWLFLGWIWAYLKLDLTTKGAYRKRLRFIFGFVILVVILLMVLVASLA